MDRNVGDISGIPPDVLKRLRSVLLRCGPFDSDADLKAVFVDSRISPWRDKVRSALSSEGRVAQLIELLHNRDAEYRPDAYKNALVLFIEVLRDNCDATDMCYSELQHLIDTIEVAPDAPLQESRSTSGSLKLKNILNGYLTTHRLCGDLQVKGAIQAFIKRTRKLWPPLRIDGRKVRVPKGISDLRSVNISRGVWLRYGLRVQIQEKYLSQMTAYGPGAEATTLSKMRRYDIDVEMRPIPIDETNKVSQPVPGTLMKILCTHCYGKGYTEKVCWRCNGTGTIAGYAASPVRILPQTQISLGETGNIKVYTERNSTACPTCHGSRVQRVDCNYCDKGFVITYKSRIKYTYPKEFPLLKGLYVTKGDVSSIPEPADHDYRLIWSAALTPNLSISFPWKDFGFNRRSQLKIQKCFDDILSELRYKVENGIIQPDPNNYSTAPTRNFGLHTLNLGYVQPSEGADYGTATVESIVVKAMEVYVEICPFYQVRYRRYAHTTKSLGDFFKKRKGPRVLPIFGEIDVIGESLHVMPPKEYEHWKRPSKDQ